MSLQKPNTSTNIINGLRVWVEQALFADAIKLHFMDIQPNGNRYVISDVVMREIKGNEIEPDTPIVLSVTAAQELMDRLWQCGLRPTEGSGSAGALAAVEKHLHDLQNLNHRLLTLIEQEAEATRLSKFDTSSVDD